MVRLLTSGAVALALISAPLIAGAYYPYSYFTGTSYLSGPSSFTGGGGYATGPMGIQSSYFDPYAAYGPGTLSYNPMSGQGGFSGYGGQAGYGGCMYSCGGSGYGSYPGFGTQSYMQYIPQHAKNYINVNAGPFRY